MVRVLTQRRATTLEVRREGASPGRQPFVGGSKSPFATDGRAGEHRDSVDHLEATDVAPRQAHTLVQGFEESLLLQIPSQEYPPKSRTRPIPQWSG